MYIILRLVCEPLSWITVNISFLWGHKHGIYAASSFSANVKSWCSRNDTQIFTSVILYMYINIIFIAQWLFGANSEFYTVPMFFHAVRNFLSQQAFSSKHVSIFFTAKIWRHSELRHSYAKGPFCVARLISLYLTGIQRLVLYIPYLVQG